MCSPTFMMEWKSGLWTISLMNLRSSSRPCSWGLSWSRVRRRRCMSAVRARSEKGVFATQTTHDTFATRRAHTHSTSPAHLGSFALAAAAMHVYPPPSLTRFRVLGVHLADQCYRQARNRRGGNFCNGFSTGPPTFMSASWRAQRNSAGRFRNANHLRSRDPAVTSP